MSKTLTFRVCGPDNCNTIDWSNKLWIDSHTIIKFELGLFQLYKIDL
jgi:hypothetical protein